MLVEAHWGVLAEAQFKNRKRPLRGIDFAPFNLNESRVFQMFEGSEFIVRIKPYFFKNLLPNSIGRDLSFFGSLSHK